MRWLDRILHRSETQPCETDAGDSDDAVAESEFVRREARRQIENRERINVVLAELDMRMKNKVRSPE